MSELLHGVVLSTGCHTNTTAPVARVAEAYPNWGNQPEGGNYIGNETLVDGVVTMQPFNSSLRFEQHGPNASAKTVEFVKREGSIGRNYTNVSIADSITISGNTVNRLCRVGQDCAKTCFLAGVALGAGDMLNANCARANTAACFEAVGVEPEGRFVLLPLPDAKKPLVVDNSTDTIHEFADSGRDLLQKRLPPAMSAVFTQSWLKSQDLSEFAVAMNGADGSFGIATTQIAGERIFVPFCSMRQNMGDRDAEDQILRKAITAYLQTRDDIRPYEYADIAKDLKISIFIGASASLANFAHKIQIPEDGSKIYEEIMANYTDLVNQAGGKITSAIVLEQQYPGALKRGSIFPQFEAQMGIRQSPISPDSCPGDGQTCHVDYRTETRYALEKQLKDMGVQRDNITYDDSQAMDPASPENNMASNRAEQNSMGVAPNNTNRTINGIVVRLGSK